MTQYNTLSVIFSNSQLNKFKSGIQNGTQWYSEIKHYFFLLFAVSVRMKI